jgi:predicted transcriptional regulator
MKLLLSIKPEFVEKILSGEKRFEYRKAGFKRSDVRTAMIYSTSPVKKLVGEFDVEEVIYGSPDNIWKKTHAQSGITKTFFDSYFESRKTAVALRIGDVRAYDTPIAPEEIIDGFKAPQSFKYLSEDLEDGVQLALPLAAE